MEFFVQLMLKFPSQSTQVPDFVKTFRQFFAFSICNSKLQPITPFRKWVNVWRRWTINQDEDRGKESLEGEVCACKKTKPQNFKKSLKIQIWMKFQW